MEKATPANLLLSLFILSASTAGGALLALKVGGSDAGYQSLRIGIFVVAAILIVQLATYFLIRERLILTIFFYATFGLSLAWFMLCLFTPVFWIAAVPAWAKYSMLISLTVLCAANSLKGFRQFSINWSAIPNPLKVGKVDSVAATIEWGKIQKSLNHRSEIYIPGLPHHVTSIISILLGISMLIGLNFRTAYPLFSAFAWGIPSAVFSSYFFQLVGYRLAEAAKVREIQCELNIVFTTKSLQ